MEKFFVLCDKELHYTAKVDEENVVLSHSDDEGWNINVRGTEIGSIVDDGDRIHLNFNGETFIIDYGDFEKLYVLMKLKMENDNFCSGIKFLSENKLDEIINKSEK